MGITPFLNKIILFHFTRFHVICQEEAFLVIENSTISKNSSFFAFFQSFFIQKRHFFIFFIKISKANVLSKAIGSKEMNIYSKTAFLKIFCLFSAKNSKIY